MKKIVVAGLALFLIAVPIHSLNAETNRTCQSPTTRSVVSGGSIGSLPTAIKGCSPVIQVKKGTTSLKIPAINIYNNREGTWTRIPAKTVTVPSKPETQPKPVPTPKPTPTPTPAPTPSPAPEPEPQPADFSAMQKEMLGYINAERASADLAPLTLDSKLCQGAYLKSQDMAVNGYFSHTSPTYGSPFEMMKNQGISYRTAGENIAKNTSVKGAHTAFMNSAGHKANILNSAFGKVGLGFYQQGQYLYVTQWFTN